MKNNLLKSTALKNRWRFGVLLFAVLCLIGSGFTRGTAQLKNHKRVTAIQLGDSAEGARVTIVSDSALGDYEAFRRGDRFYVKIPLADFATPQPGFHGDGFDDVQVQTVGDSVVISFKLQLGATARVNQRSNRLDVIFSAPSRIARNNNSNSVFNRVSSSATSGINRVNSATNISNRQGDSAGPVPPSTPQATRERTLAARQGEDQSQPLGLNARGSSRKVENNRSSSSKESSKSAGPVDSQPTALPTLTPYQPATSTSPVNSQPGNNSSAATTSQSWNSRGKAAREWVSANRNLLGALALLAALLLLAAFLYRRRKTVVKSKATKEPRVQPKYSPNIALSEALAADAAVSSTTKPASKPTPKVAANLAQDEYKLRPVKSDFRATTVQPASAGVSRPGALENAEQVKSATEPAMAGSLGGPVPPTHAWVLSRPSINAPETGDDQLSSEDEDREVFEL